MNNLQLKKNCLVTSDYSRLYPLNKIADGSAIVAEAKTDFKDGINNMNPKLFAYFEKIKQNKKITSNSQFE